MGFIKTAVSLFFIYVAYKVIRIFFAIYKQGKRVNNETGTEKEGAVEDLICDPVCGKYFPASKAVRWEHNGRKQHFCSQECLVEFEKRHK